MPRENATFARKSFVTFRFQLSRHTYVARMLLTAGEDINTLDDLGLTPDHYAITPSRDCTKESFDSFFNHRL